MADSFDDLKAAPLEQLGKLYAALAEQRGVSVERRLIARAMIAQIKERDRPMCGTCRHWGDGSGTGMPYDAGHMNYCNQEQIDGSQHPSYGVMEERKTMLYAQSKEGFEGRQYIMTRITFGCNLHQPLVPKTGK